MKMVKKYLKKDMYFQKKDKKIIDDLRLIEQYNNEILNLSGNTPNQLCKSRTKNWVEKNDNARGTYNTYSQIGFKTSMLK